MHNSCTPRPASDFTPTERLATDPVTERYINAMVAKMRQANGFGDIPPIQVFQGQMGALEVIDGHHRLEAAKRAGVDVSWQHASQTTVQLWLHWHRRLGEFSEWLRRSGGTP
jgi:hypothetical protein